MTPLYAAIARWREIGASFVRNFRDFEMAVVDVAERIGAPR